MSVENQFMLNFVFFGRILTIASCLVMLSAKTGDPEALQGTGEVLLQDVTNSELKDIIDSYEGEKAVLVNVWATWCAPCVKEFPEIVRLQRAYPERLKVIFVSADFEESRDKAVSFLKEQGVDWTTYFKTGNDQQFIETLSPDWTGALPFTKILGINGGVVASWEQSADYETFERHLKLAINH